VAAVTFLLWWASDLLVDIVLGLGSGPTTESSVRPGLLQFFVAVTAALTLIGRRVLQGALFVGSGAALIALVLLLVQGIPTLETSLDWSWSTPWMTVVSAGSLLLALATLVVVFSAADLTTLRASSSSRAGGVLSAAALGLPFVALSVMASWMAQSSPVVSLGLLANPVGTLTEGAPAFYPALAIIAVVRASGERCSTPHILGKPGSVYFANSRPLSRSHCGGDCTGDGAGNSGSGVRPGLD
jgi:hypothetical protein